MDKLLPEFTRMLKLLNKYDVHYMIIGGYAVIFHGYARTTEDMDIWVQPENTNRDRLIEALREFGIEENDLSRLSEVNFTQTHFFYFGEKPRRIDFLTRINNVEFKEAEAKVDLLCIDNDQFPVIDYHQLVLSKISNGRPQDKADLDMLQKINRYKKK